MTEAPILKRGLRLWPLALAMFCCASGGPYGLEPVMQAGHGMAILLILLTPLIWSLPAALMTAELSTMIPHEGGYYLWAKRGLGPMWGFLCGWWSWVYTWVDAAIYPGLFAKYVAGLIELGGYTASIEERPWLKWAIGLVIVIPFTWLNVRGSNKVGSASVWIALLFLIPFAILVALGLPALFAHPAGAVQPFVPSGESAREAFNTGLFAVMWNYLGWDSLSTVAGEVENPRRAYPRALAIALPLTVLCYLLPSLVGIVALPHPAAWDEGSWTAVAKAIGGSWLAFLITAGGMASAAGLFAATLLGASRVPFVLAEDGFLSKRLTRLHPRFGTPVLAIMLSAAVYTVLSYNRFEFLVEADVALYASALLIEFAALVAFRIKEPDRERPYRIPGGWPVLALVAILPALLTAFAFTNQFHEEGWHGLWLSLGALATGPIAYLVARNVARAARP